MTISIGIEYWNTDGIASPPATDPEALSVIYWPYGDVTAFDLAMPDPLHEAEACLSDPQVDPSTIVQAETPFPRLRLALLPTADSLDLQRVRDCLTSSLIAGTLVVFPPYE